MWEKTIYIIIIFLVITHIVFAQTTSQWDLLNFYEHEKLARPDIIKPYQIISIPQAWQKIKDLNPTLNNVVVGIIDTGVDSKHPEFTNPNINFGNTPPDALNDIQVESGKAGHGTHVAGIIGANNISGVRGYTFSQMNGILSGTLLPNLYSLEVRRVQSFIQTTPQNFFGIQQVATVGKISKALEGMNTQVTNLSYGLLNCSTFLGLTLPSNYGCIKDKYFTEVTNFFEEGFNSKPDTLFVIGAGNEDTDSINSTPANIKLNNTLIVGATGLSDERADFPFPKTGKSNFGPGVDISAPGIGVYTSAMRNSEGNFPQANGDYVTDFSGTSASAPMVTGVAGLLKALEPEYKKYTPGLLMTPAKIKEILIASADPINTGEPDKPLGSGCYNEVPSDTGCRLNAHRAVAWFFPPKSVENLTASNITASSITLNWSKSSDFDFQNPDFANYKIFRDINSNVDTDDALVTTITNFNLTSFTDTNLTPNTTFFYKVFVFDKANLSTASNEVSAATLAARIPFFIIPVGEIPGARAFGFSMITNTQKVAQDFIAAGNNILREIDVEALAKSGNPIDSVIMSVYQGGVKPEEGVFLGNSNPILGSTLPTNLGTTFTFTLPSPIQLQQNQRYFLVVRRTGSLDDFNRYLIFVTIISTAPGAKWEYVPILGGWNSTINDIPLELFSFDDLRQFLSSLKIKN